MTLIYQFPLSNKKNRPSTDVHRLNTSLLDGLRAPLHFKFEGDDAANIRQAAARFGKSPTDYALALIAGCARVERA